MITTPLEARVTCTCDWPGPHTGTALTEWGAASGTAVRLQSHRSLSWKLRSGFPFLIEHHLGAGSLIGGFLRGPFPRRALVPESFLVRTRDPGLRMRCDCYVSLEEQRPCISLTVMMRNCSMLEVYIRSDLL